MIVSIKFKDVGLFQSGMSFSHKFPIYSFKIYSDLSNADQWVLNYMGRSKSTGNSIFRIVSSGKLPLENYCYYESTFDYVIHDQIESYTELDRVNQDDLVHIIKKRVKANKKKINEKLLELMNIDEFLLQHDGSWVNIIRDLKLQFSLGPVYTESEVENLLEKQRGNCYVAVQMASRNDDLAMQCVKSPEPGLWRKS